MPNRIIAVASIILFVSVYAIYCGYHSYRNPNSKGSLDVEHSSFAKSSLYPSVATSSNSDFSKANGDIIMVPRKLADLSSNEFQNVKLAAERSNDVSSAVDLADYFGYVVNDVTNRIKYLKIAASHGHVISQYNLGFIYANYDEFKNLDEAKYWFEIAANNGSSYAKDQLDLMRRK